jgi:hypothetical protein
MVSNVGSQEFGRSEFISHSYLCCHGTGILLLKKAAEQIFCENLI